MNKHILSFLALLCAAQMAWAATVTTPAGIPDYYSSVDGKSAANLWSAVSSVAARNRGNLGYDGLYTAYIKTDSYPEDSVGKAGKVWDMYSNCGYTHNQRKCGSYSDECDCYNREHSIPKSWFGGSTSGIGCDIFHVVPTDGKVNGMRSAYVYGEVKGSPEYTSLSGHKKGSGDAIFNARKTICAAAGSTTPCSAGTVFEPVDQYKGDFARGYMGIMASWNRDMTQAEGAKFFKSTYTAANNYGLTAYGVALLMKWHREDPVSQKEIDRNNGIQMTQGNRNPFIDYPYLAEYIWGEHAGETVDLAQLMPSTDPAFVPGVSNGWRDGTVPPQPGVTKYGVTWSVNGEILRTDSVIEDGKIVELPAEPSSCSDESSVFMGWTDAPIAGIQNEAPETLYRAIVEFPAVTADVTYYAVFAKETVEEGIAPAIYTYSADSQEGWTNTAFTINSYWILRSGLYLESPEINLAGLSSISMTMRTYGGTSYNTVKVMASGTQIATLQAANSTLTENTWTNTASLSGISKLRFESETSTDKYGPAFSSVKVNATGAGVTYSNYLTSCGGGDHTAIENEQISVPTHKILRDGRLLIVIGDQIYNVMGQRIQ